MLFSLVYVKNCFLKIISFPLLEQLKSLYYYLSMTLNNLLYIKVLEGVKCDVNKQILATGVNYALRGL